MLWYVIQTYTGKEEELAEMIRRMVPGNCYGECFVAYHEQLRDRRQENQIHILRLFPGYIFISSDDVDRLFLCLKMVPAMTRIVSSGAFVFTPLYEGEAEFLIEMMDENHVVRLTYAATDGKDHVSYLSGPLERCRALIQSYQFRKRYALVRLRIAGHEKIVRMGIILNDDIRREMRYGKVEAPVRAPERYEVLPLGKEERETAVCPESGARFAPGDRVAVIEGAFAGNVAAVNRAEEGTVRISVEMFGREISAEVPAGSVRKLSFVRSGHC